MEQKSETQHIFERVTPLVTLRWLIAVLIDWAIIIGAMWFAITGGEWWMYLIALFVVGNRQHALSILGHDGAHYLITRNRILNDVLANVFAFWLLDANVGRYRMFHIEHHKYLGSGLDPELHAKKKQAPLWDLPLTKKDMIVQFFKDLSGLQIREQIAFLKLIGPPANKYDAVGHILFYGLVLWALYVYKILIPVLFIWFLAEATTFWAIFRLRMYSEHVGTPDAYRIKASWWAKLFFLPHNTWYHWEHHYNYNVPFFRLSKLRKLNPRPEVEVRQLSDVFASYATMPRIESGTPLRNLPLDGSVKVEM